MKYLTNKKQRTFWIAFAQILFWIYAVPMKQPFKSRRIEINGIYYGESFC